MGTSTVLLTNPGRPSSTWSPATARPTQEHEHNPFLKTIGSSAFAGIARTVETCLTTAQRTGAAALAVAGTNGNLNWRATTEVGHILSAKATAGAAAGPAAGTSSERRRRVGLVLTDGLRLLRLMSTCADFSSTTDGTACAPIKLRVGLAADGTPDSVQLESRLLTMMGRGLAGRRDGALFQIITLAVTQCTPILRKATNLPLPERLGVPAAEDGAPRCLERLCELSELRMDMMRLRFGENTTQRLLGTVCALAELANMALCREGGVDGPVQFEHVALADEAVKRLGLRWSSTRLLRSLTASSSQHSVEAATTGRDFFVSCMYAGIYSRVVGLLNSLAPPATLAVAGGGEPAGAAAGQPNGEVVVVTSAGLTAFHSIDDEEGVRPSHGFGLDLLLQGACHEGAEDSLRVARLDAGVRLLQDEQLPVVLPSHVRAALEASPIIQLLEGRAQPLGLVPQLSELVTYSGAGHKRGRQMMHRALERIASRSELVQLRGPQTDPSAANFAVKHAGGTACLSADDLCSSAVAGLAGDLLDALAQGSNQLTRHLGESLPTTLKAATAPSFPVGQEARGKRQPSATAKGATVHASQVVMAQIDWHRELWGDMEDMNPVAVRVLDAGSQELRRKGDMRVCPLAIARQLASGSTVADLALTRASYAHRLPLPAFYNRYVVLVSDPSFVATHGSSVAQSAPAARAREACEVLVDTLARSSRVLNQILLQGGKAQLAFGRSQVFLRGELFDRLESTRAHLLASMDNAATTVQKQLRSWWQRRRYLVQRRRLVLAQATYRCWKERQAYLYHRHYAMAIKAFLVATHQRSEYLRMRAAARMVQACWRRFAQRNRFLSLRVTLLMVHTVARGFLMRNMLLAQHKAVLCLQRQARSFLVRLRIWRSQIRAVTSLQAARRGYLVRRANPAVVAYIEDYRRQAAGQKFFRLAFAIYKGKLVRGRYLQLREAVVRVQQWTRRCLSRVRTAQRQQAAVRMQALLRGHLVRRLTGTVTSVREAAEAAWRIHRLRQAEQAQLKQHAQQLQSTAYWQELRRDNPSALVSSDLRSRAAAAGGRTDGAVVRPIDVDVVMEDVPLLLERQGDGSRSVVAPAQDDDEGSWMRQVGAVEQRLRAGSTRTKELALGSTHTTVLATNGQVYTWGWGDRGQLGLGELVGGTGRPTLVRALSRDVLSMEPEFRAFNAFGWGLRERVLHIAAGGDHTLAVTSSGRVLSWGDNSHGQLGLGPAAPRTVAAPAHVTGLTRAVASVAAGARHSAFLLRSGSVYTCGRAFHTGAALNPEDGAEGDVASGAVSNAVVFTPTGIRTIAHHNIRKVSCGWGHTACLSTNGDIFAWGSGKDGQVGQGAFADRRAPCLVMASANVNQRQARLGLVAEGSLAASETGTLVASAPGNGSVPAIRGAAAAVDYRGLGQAQERAQLVAEQRAKALRGLRTEGSRRAGSEAFRDVACGAHHTVAVTTAGRMYAWGRNYSGQLGVGDRENRCLPVPVMPPVSDSTGEQPAGPVVVVAVAAGLRDSYALTRGGSVFSWGQAGALRCAGLREIGAAPPVVPGRPETFMSPIEDVVPVPRKLAFTEGFRPTKLSCTWSSTRSAVVAGFERAQPTAGMVRSTLLRLADVAEQEAKLQPAAEAEQEQASSPEPTTLVRAEGGVLAEGNLRTRAAAVGMEWAEACAQAVSTMLHKQPELRRVYAQYLQDKRAAAAAGPNGSRRSPPPVARDQARAQARQRATVSTRASMIDSTISEYTDRLLRARELTATLEQSVTDGASTARGRLRSSQALRQATGQHSAALLAAKAAISTASGQLPGAVESAIAARWPSLSPAQRFLVLGLGREHLALLEPEQLARLSYAFRAPSLAAARPAIALAMCEKPSHTQGEATARFNFRAATLASDDEERRRRRAAALLSRKQTQRLAESGVLAAADDEDELGSKAVRSPRRERFLGYVTASKHDHIIARERHWRAPHGGPSEDAEAAAAASATEDLQAALRSRMRPFRTRELALQHESTALQSLEDGRRQARREHDAQHQLVLPASRGRRHPLSGLQLGHKPASTIGARSSAAFKEVLLPGGRFDAIESQRAAFEQAFKLDERRAGKLSETAASKAELHAWRGSRAGGGRDAIPANMLGQLFSPMRRVAARRKITNQGWGGGQEARVPEPESRPASTRRSPRRDEPKPPTPPPIDLPVHALVGDDEGSRAPPPAPQLSAPPQLRGLAEVEEEQTPRPNAVQPEPLPVPTSGLFTAASFRRGTPPRSNPFLPDSPPNPFLPASVTGSPTRPPASPPDASDSQAARRHERAQEILKGLDMSRFGLGGSQV